MSPIIWSAGILGIAVAGILGQRILSKRVRIAFDAACVTALSALLYHHGASPFSQPPTGSPVWLRMTIVAWWLLSARVAVAALYFAVGHDRKSREAKLFIDLVAAAVYAATTLIVLKSVLALPIGGLVATSGIVAIVLGLALQSTLADVFSGIAVGIEAPFKIGDRISLDNNIEGQVVEMNWRSIRIQTDGADIAIIPNNVVAKLQIVNRSVPSRVRAVSVQTWCPASADPERVVEALEQATMLCPSILTSPSPGIALTRVGPRWNTYTISFSVSDTPLMGPTKSQLLRHARRQLYHARLLAQGRNRHADPCDDRMHSSILPARRILRELALFECLQSEQLDELAGHLKTRLLEPGELLFAQGASDATLYVVASGVLEITRVTETAPALSLGCLGAGEYVGEICLLTGAPHAASAQARTHCYIHYLSREAIEPLLAANMEMVAAFEKSVRRGLDILHRSVAVSATEGVGTRNQLFERIRSFFRFRSTG